MNRITGRMDDERGLTLTELLITVVILGIIMAPLSNAMISFVRISDQTSQQLSESHDIQLAAAYFAQDVQSVGVRDWAAYPYPATPSVELPPFTTPLFPCGVVTGTAVRFAWDDPTSPTGPLVRVIVAYQVRNVDGESQLRRITCHDTNPTPISDLAMAHNVVGATATAAPSGTAGKITLQLKVRDPENTGPEVTIELQGQRRQT